MRRDDDLPPTIEYATPARAAPRPTVALWVAAGLVWAGAAGVLVAIAVAVWRGAGNAPGELAVAGLVALVVAGCEWRAAVARSVLATWLMFAAATLLSGFAWVTGIGIAFVAHDDGWLGDAPIAAAAVFGLAAALSFVALMHGRWALRLVRERPASGGNDDA